MIGNSNECNPKLRKQENKSNVFCFLDYREDHTAKVKMHFCLFGLGFRLTRKNIPHESINISIFTLTEGSTVDDSLFQKPKGMIQSSKKQSE